MYVMLKFYRPGHWFGEYRDSHLGGPKEADRYNTWHWTIGVSDGKMLAWAREAHEMVLRPICARVTVVPPGEEGTFPPFAYEPGAVVTVLLDGTLEDENAWMFAWVGREDPFNMIKGKMDRKGNAWDMLFEGEDERDMSDALNAVTHAGPIWSWLVMMAKMTKAQPYQERAVRDTGVA